jgi:hypothetical protein
LIRQALVNQVGQRVKHTGTQSCPRCGRRIPIEHVIFVRDNGVGSIRATPTNFRSISTLHQPDFEGTGIGLANVRQMIAATVVAPGPKAI